MKKVLIAILTIGALGAWFGYRHWRAPKPAESGQEQRILYYHCPMHPDYHSDRQGDCPICGMRLTPVHAEERSSAAPSGQIHISPEKQHLIGVQVGEASMASVSRTIRAVGRVALDETRVVKIHPRVDGWVEAVYGDFLGQFIQKGQPLVKIYSPELAATQQEYLLALRSQEIMQHSSMPGVAARSGSLVEAARRRLGLWDLSEPQIEELHRTRKPSAAITLFAPASGHVIARNSYEKQRVTPETELYTVADLSRVWVMADVFENDIPAISLGQPAQIIMTYAGGRSYPARVNYIQPSLDPATRTLKVRLEVDNPGLRLKPEMFTDVEFRVHVPARLIVPSGAVLDSGLAKTVFVDRGNGYFEPRGVETGGESEDRVEILSGLKPGERIVTSGTFLIDSESQIKAAARGMGQHDQHNH